MAHDDPMLHEMRARQLQLAGIMQVRGWCLKGVSFHSGIPYSTLRSYFPGERNGVPAIMPISAFAKLIGAVPNEWLSILIGPDARLASSNEDVTDLTRVREARDILDKLITRNGGSHEPA